jgi:hypothetical protein
MSAVKLSERQRAALLALHALAKPAGGYELAERMNASGFRANSYSAHQAANGLAYKGLAVKGTYLIEGTACVGYELTEQGRSVAARIGAAT